MRNVAICILILMGVVLLYRPVAGYSFINYDDNTYITGNPHIRQGVAWSTLKWAFTSLEYSNWHPLTWISHALDVELFGIQPSGHHLTSLLLHALNSMVLFLLAFSATKRLGPSLVLALLFAAHPMNVESVAWIAERKNVLSTFFFFLTLGAYGWYVRRPHWLRYSLVAILYACGLMSKPMLVTLPFVLLLLDYWPLERLAGNRDVAKLLVEKGPLLLMSVVSSVLTFHAQQIGHSMVYGARFPFTVRLENAIGAYGLYLWKMVWPTSLAVFYPHPGASISLWKVVASGFVLAAITVLVVVFRRRKYLATGWFWFLGTLVPVIGIVQVGDQAMADRYGYLPLIGLFLMCTWGAADLFGSQGNARIVCAAASAGVVLAFSFLTDRQVRYWSSDAVLWSHALAVTANNSLAEQKLGVALMASKRPEEALPHFRRAVAISPTDPMNHVNLGVCLEANHEPNPAIDEFKKAIAASSDRKELASAYTNLGEAYDEVGRDTEARDSYDRALQLNPEQAAAYVGRGLLHERQGRFEEAAADYQRSVGLQPSAKGYLGLSRVLQRLNRISEAQAFYQKAMELAAGRNLIP